MTTRLLTGPAHWSMQRDSEGHRTYKIKYKVACDKTDGPAQAILTTGLPRTGDIWAVDGDLDPWAWCRPDVSVTPALSDQPNKQFELEYTFSSKPLSRDQQRDPFAGVPEDPLLEPAKISLGSRSSREEAVLNRFGNHILSSSHEQLRGPQVEFDIGTAYVRIDQNFSVLNLPLHTIMLNTVNDRELWGMPRRTIKLSSFTIDRRYYGTGGVYYNRILEFDIDFRTWDRDVLDQGTKVLQGRWADDGSWINTPINSSGDLPDPENPAHYMRAIDRQGNHCIVVLDGAGNPYAPSEIIKTTACAQCPNGSPTVWKCEGFGDSDVNGVNIYMPDAATLDELFDFTAPFNLSYVSGCTWRSGVTEVADIVTLEYSSTSWVLTSSLYPDSAWALAGTSWRCMGPNTLARISGNGPGAIVVRMSPTSNPGSIRVEKYLESNFLLLTIPTTF